MRYFILAAFAAFFIAAPVVAGPPAWLGGGPPGNKVVVIPTVQNSSYSSGNCMGGFQAVQNMAYYPGESVLLNSVDIKSIGGGTETITVYVFDAYPSASVCTDKSTFTLATADTDKLVAPPFALTLVAPTGTSESFASQSNMARIYVGGGNPAVGANPTYDANLYFALVSGSTVTPGTTTDLHVTFEGQMVN